MAASIRTGSPAGGHSLLKNYHRPVLWVVLACLFGLDIITTTVSLDLGYFEGNPLMVPFASDPLLHGLVKIGAYLLLFGVIEQAVAFLSGGRPDGQPLLPQMHSAGLYGLIITAMVSLAGLYAAVLVHNIRMIAAAAGAG
jgi:hypothetical protein